MNWARPLDPVKPLFFDGSASWFLLSLPFVLVPIGFFACHRLRRVNFSERPFTVPISNLLARVAQTVDNVVHRINRYPVDRR